MPDYISDQIHAIARECRLTAAKIQKNFGGIKTNRREMLIEAISLQSQANNLHLLMRRWFDDTEINP